MIDKRFSADIFYLQTNNKAKERRTKKMKKLTRLFTTSVITTAYAIIDGFRLSRTDFAFRTPGIEI